MVIKDYTRIERAAGISRSEVGRIGTALLFMVGIMVFTGSKFAGNEQSFLLIAAALVGAYMAMNIGANDVANNVGPAVGSFALSMTGAIVIAAICEAAGAIIAGGEVVKTVKDGIIDPAGLGQGPDYVWVMMGALMGAALWLNLATWLGAPVSTTHSIVGGVMGAGIAAAGWDIVNWASVGTIAISWVISPVMGGLVAAALLFILKKLVFFREDPLHHARDVVPVMIALMAWAFTTYLCLKGIKQLVEISFPMAALLGLAAAVAALLITRPLIMRAVPRMRGTPDAVNRLFTVPLIFAAALLSFAHGANDVANAVGPLAGVVDVLTHGEAASSSAPIPFWVMAIGALGISLGLALFGPRLIRTVGSEITELDRSRAFCIALSAAITVILASQLGLPISSTHVALGGVFGVGFLREYLQSRLGRVIEDVLSRHQGKPDFSAAEAVLRDFQNAPVEEKRAILQHLKQMGPESVIDKAQRKQLKKALKKQLVSRSSVLKIVSAWVITLPVTGFLSAMMYFVLRGMLLP